MKKGNKFLEITLCLMMMLLLVGCENKKVITLDTFKEKATSNNYIVSDVTSQFKKSKIVKTATTANNLSKWVIELSICLIIIKMKLLNQNQKIQKKYLTVVVTLLLIH